MEDIRQGPLAGKRIVVTRAPEQTTELVRRLENLGAEVLLFPTVSFREPPEQGPLDAVIRKVGQFDWLLFTSQNATRFFALRCRALGLDVSKLQGPRPFVGAVGLATADAAEKEGFRVDHVARTHSGLALGRELRGSIADKKILLPRSDRAGDELPTALREAGAHVTEVVAYCTTGPEEIPADLLARLRRGEADVLTFASPSAFVHFSEAMGAELLRRLLSRAVITVIGPTTARTIREAGYRVAIECEDATAVGWATAIREYFERVPSRVKML